jgi:hypothetical protein
MTADAFAGRLFGAAIAPIEHEMLRFFVLH